MQPVRFRGEVLRNLRKSKNWSQSELFQRSGVSVSHISQLEKGTRKSPSLDMAYRLAEALSVSLYDFIDNKDNEIVVHIPYNHVQSIGLPDIREGLTQEPERVAEHLTYWGRTVRPDILSFITSEDAQIYLALVKELYDCRESPKALLQLINDFLQGTNP